MSLDIIRARALGTGERTVKVRDSMIGIMKEGNYEKYGAHRDKNGITFTFEAEGEAECSLLLYEKGQEITEEIAIPAAYCRGAVRSFCLGQIEEKKLRYNYRIDGKIVTDPYATRIIGREKWNDAGRAALAYQVCGGCASADFDWGEDQAPEVPRREMVMYKLHVRGFTMDAGIRGKNRGTFAAVRERIPYLKELGITTLLFMPVYEFEEMAFLDASGVSSPIVWAAKEGDRIQPIAQDRSGKVNFWGYVPGNYFAVKASYSSAKDAAREWRELILALHANGMECVMEMYFGETQSYGAILDVLRYWVREYHVDGFHLIGENLPMTMIAQDAWLARTKIFGEGYETALLEKAWRYPHLFVYSDEYLYPVRAMLNHMNSNMESFACQQRKQHAKLGFVNYIADNNGFTLLDLFSYGEKHNEENGEGGRDGSNWNLSNNYGVEGRTAQKHVCRIREQQLRNAIAVLMLGQGVPLLCEGDEAGNSQSGNNNAYCQDNPVGWVNWKKNARYGWLTDFTREMIAFRRAHPVIASDAPKMLNDFMRKGFPDLSYHGEHAWVAPLSEDRRSVGMMYCGAYERLADGNTDDFIYLGYNFHVGLDRLALPKLPEKKHWYLAMDTSRDARAFLEKEELCRESQIPLKGQSVVILVGK